ncbi:MAG: transporter substrate-binding domain-containing protein, partial [Myxococcota bacterium]
ELLTDLKNDRFDVAMGGITVRPERSIAGRFTVPITTSGAVILIPEASPFVTTRDLDRTDLQIAVNSGGHLEQVARAHFPNARIRAMDQNQNVIRALAQGDVDAAVSDTRESVIWQNSHPSLRALEPFTRDRKAWLVTAQRPGLARDLDAWLLSAQADGRLDGLRAQELAEVPSTAAVTEPLPALLAAVDERLALMPWVAKAKRSTGTPVEAPEVEARVLQAAVADVRAAEQRNPAAHARNEDDIRRFFRTQIEAAKAVQRRTLASAPSNTEHPPPDLVRELRPALLRLGDRIATLVVALPLNLQEAQVREAVRRELNSPRLHEEDKSAIADALVELVVQTEPAVLSGSAAEGRTLDQ